MFTTYRAGKIFLVGLSSEDRLSIFERTIDRCMGLWVDGNSLVAASHYKILGFENALPPGEVHDGYDRLYVPQVGYVTGDLDVHDVVRDSGGRTIFANTRFSCLATTNDQKSFIPIWTPPFISELAPEDRCHCERHRAQGRRNQMGDHGCSDRHEGGVAGSSSRRWSGHGRHIEFGRS